jgi:hypothetical protein
MNYILNDLIENSTLYRQEIELNNQRRFLCIED